MGLTLKMYRKNETFFAVFSDDIYLNLFVIHYLYGTPGTILQLGICEITLEALIQTQTSFIITVPVDWFLVCNMLYTISEI
jgi:hypothetical protein